MEINTVPKEFHHQSEPFMKLISVTFGLTTTSNISLTFSSSLHMGHKIGG